MKKLKVLLVLSSLLLLIGCKAENQEVEEVLEFDNLEFSYIGDTEDDYRFYRTGAIELEVKMIDEDLTASYEKDLDIYIILGKEDSYIIRKNGDMILACSGEDIACSGIESPVFLDDIDNLFAIFEEENSINSVGLIIGLILANASFILFFLPNSIAKIFENTKLANIRLNYIRLFFVLLFGIGVLLVITSLNI